jgi:hypothetical protein
MLRRSAALLLFIALAGSSALLGQDSSKFDWKAFHRANDREWSYKTGLPPEDIRRLRLAAGIKDDEELNPIDLIDGKTLGHERILLVTAAGSGHCLTVAVYEPHGKGYREVWSASEMPEGAGFCHPSLCRDAEARAEKKNRIVVSVPGQTEDAKMGVCDLQTVLTFQAAGKSYVLAKTEQVDERCRAEDYMRALSEAFTPDASPDGRERLITIIRVPGFEAEWAFAMDKTANGLELKRLAFREPKRLPSIFSKPRTPSHCIAEAKSIPIDETAVSISQSDAQRLMNELSKIDLNTDSCPRNPNGTCAHFLDGTTYRLVFPDGRIVQLENVSGLKGVRSQNPALLDWLDELMKYVRAQANKPAQ